jgi:lysophospholipase L1-like esterase
MTFPPRRTLSVATALLAAAFCLRTEPAAAQAAAAPSGAEDRPACIPVPMPPMAVPHMRAAILGNQPVIIAALGSSSTQSYRASDTGHSYPAVLQDRLSAALPSVHVAVINRGIGGEDAPEELARMDKDVLALRPQVVIWQVGSNGVLRSENPQVFKRLVSAGVKKLHDAGADVILMDNQQAPALLQKPEHLVMDQALAEVATATNSSLFARSSLMEAWEKAGEPYGHFISADGLHHNNRGYRCLADSLAGAITAGLGPDLAGAGPIGGPPPVEQRASR